MANSNSICCRVLCLMVFVGTFVPGIILTLSGAALHRRTKSMTEFLNKGVEQALCDIQPKPPSIDCVENTGDNNDGTASWVRCLCRCSVTTASSEIAVLGSFCAGQPADAERCPHESLQQMQSYSCLKGKGDIDQPIAVPASYLHRGNVVTFEGLKREMETAGRTHIIVGPVSLGIAVCALISLIVSCCGYSCTGQTPRRGNGPILTNGQKDQGNDIHNDDRNNSLVTRRSRKCGCC